MSRREPGRACREARQEGRLAEPVTEEAGGSWADRAMRERTLTGEKLAERLDEQGYEREREAYRQYLAHREECGA